MSPKFHFCDNFYFAGSWLPIQVDNTHLQLENVFCVLLSNLKMDFLFVGPLQRVRPRNGILALVLVPLRSEFIGEL